MNLVESQYNVSIDTLITAAIKIQRFWRRYIVINYKALILLNIYIKTLLCLNSYLRIFKFFNITRI